MPTISQILFDISFEWDDEKEKLVLQQHKVTFTECCSVFVDVNHVTIFDKRFDDNEQRYITIGISNQAKLLVVAWTQRADTIRLITAMKAEKHHEKRYNRGY